MPKWHWTEIQLQSRAEAEPVPVVWSAVVAVRGWGGGRMIPLLILDTTKRPDIDDMIRAHQHLGPGDATSGWSLPSRWTRDKIRLVLTMTRPTRCTMIMEFDLSKWGGPVDQIVLAQSVYIQAGRPGDRLVTTMEHGRLLVEIPAREFREEWDRIFRKSVVDKFRRDGMNRTQAKQAAEQFVKTWRDVLAMRMRSD